MPPLPPSLGSPKEIIHTPAPPNPPKRPHKPIAPRNDCPVISKLSVGIDDNIGTPQLHGIRKSTGVRAGGSKRATQ